MKDIITIVIDRDFSNAYSAVEKISLCDEFDKFTIVYSDNMKYAYDSRVKAIRDILFAKRIFDVVKGAADSKKLLTVE